MAELPDWIPERWRGRLPFGLIEMFPHTPSDYLEYYDGTKLREGDRFTHAGEPCQVTCVWDPGPDGGVRVHYRHLWW